MPGNTLEKRLHNELRLFVIPLCGDLVYAAVKMMVYGFSDAVLFSGFLFGCILSAVLGIPFLLRPPLPRVSGAACAERVDSKPAGQPFLPGTALATAVDISCRRCRIGRVVYPGPRHHRKNPCLKPGRCSTWLGGDCCHPVVGRAGIEWARWDRFICFVWGKLICQIFYK